MACSSSNDQYVAPRTEQIQIPLCFCAPAFLGDWLDLDITRPVDCEDYFRAKHKPSNTSTVHLEVTPVRLTGRSNLVPI